MLSSSKGKFLDILQIFRGIAAIMVVLHHSITSLKHYNHLDNNLLIFIGQVGKYGVDFFFLLSGFIISYSSYYKTDQPQTLKKYGINRILRIYIPYLPIGILALVLYLNFSGLSNSAREIDTLTSLTLIPSGRPALSVAWTLSYEIIFYLLFSIYFFSKKVWESFVLLWFVLIICFNYFFTHIQELSGLPVISLLLSPYNFEFIMGYLLSKLILKEFKINFYGCLLIMVLSALVFIYFLKNEIVLFDFAMNIIFSIFTFSVIYFSITFYNPRFSKKALFMIIGNATFSIYLVHNQLQEIIIRLSSKIDSLLETIFLLLFIVCVCCSVGYVYYLIFEKALLHKARFFFKV